MRLAEAVWPEFSGRSTRAFAFAPVTPGVNDQDKGANKAEDREDNRPRLVLPKLPEASEYFREIHATAKLHPQAP